MAAHHASRHHVASSKYCASRVKTKRCHLRWRPPIIKSLAAWHRLCRRPACCAIAASAIKACRRHHIMLCLMRKLLSIACQLSARNARLRRDIRKAEKAARARSWRNRNSRAGLRKRSPALLRNRRQSCAAAALSKMLASCAPRLSRGVKASIMAITRAHRRPYVNARRRRPLILGARSAGQYRAA